MNVLLVGCGKKWGRQLLDSFVDKKHNVYSLSSCIIENIDNYQVNWATTNVAKIEKFLKKLPQLDFVLFNQNGSALNTENFFQTQTIELWKLEKNWNQQYFNSVILPYHIIQSIKLKKTTIISWMLSSYVYRHSNINYADYIGNKYQNYLIMKNFSKTETSCFCGINPTSLYDHEIDTNQFINNFFNQKIEKLNGNVVYLDGQIDTNFKLFLES
jgi:hypothetical protein